MATTRTHFLKQFCHAAGIEEGTLTVKFHPDIPLAHFTRIHQWVSDTIRREPRWSKGWLVVEHIRLDDATHIVAEIRDEMTPQERYEDGISVEFEGPGWVEPLTILHLRRPSDPEDD